MMNVRAFRFMTFPAAEWDAVKAERLSAAQVLCTHLVPWSLVPAVAWGLGAFFFNASVSGQIALAARLGIGTFVLCLVSIGICALAFGLVMPMYGSARDWRLAVSLAAYASTPVLMAGILLILPVLIGMEIIAVLHGLYLAYIGAQRLLGVPPSDAAEFLAAAGVLWAGGSSLLGALLGWLGLIG